MMSIAVGFLIPLIGTVLGSACVYLMSDSFNRSMQRVLTGFAAGVMTAASVWSLLIPAIEQSSAMGHWAFLPAAAGFWIGTLFLLMLDRIIPHLHMYSSVPEGRRSGLSGNVMLLLAVTLHNIPEGMAVGAVYAGLAGGAVHVLGRAAGCACDAGFSELCGRCHDLCGCGGTDTGNVIGRTFKRGRSFVCRRLFADDGA